MPEFKAALGNLVQQPDQPSHYQEYARYYQAQALFQGDIEAWQKWNKQLIQQIKAGQAADGSIASQFGATVGTSLSLLRWPLITVSCPFMSVELAMDAKQFCAGPRRVVGTVVGMLLIGLVALAATPAFSQVLEVKVLVDGAELTQAEAAPRAATSPAPAPESSNSLRLTNGDHLIGKLIDSPAGEDLAWQAEGFAGPFSVPRDAAQEIQFAGATLPTAPQGKYAFLLTHQARLVGSLLSIDPQTVAIDVVGIGRLQVDRSALQRMYRCDSPTLVYVGPQGMDGWLTTGPKDAWQTDGGCLSTEGAHSGLLRNFGDLPQACFEIEVSWKGFPISPPSAST